MINLTIQNTIQNTIKNTLGNLSEKFITQLFVPVGSDSFITADNKIFKVRVDMSTILYLFAEDQRGVWYDPSDLATLYQTVNGTAVTADGQPVGLMLDKSRGGALSDELITNGTFDTDVSGWSAENAVISVDSGNLVIDDTANAGPNSGAYQDITTVQGKHYFISFDKVSTTTEFYLRIGSSPSFQDILYSSLGVSTGTYFSRFIATDSTTRISVICGGEGVTKYDNISVKEITGNFARQVVSTKRPTYKDTPDRLEIDLVDDALLFDVPLGGIDGYMVIGTNDGTASYGVSLPAGDYDIGGDYFMGGSVNGFLLREGAVSASDLRNVEKDFVSKGAKESYGDVTDFSFYWRSKNITEFPLIDTSSGTNFAFAWYGNNLTSFPLIDTSKGIDFLWAWRGNNLANFPLRDTSSRTNFVGAWQDNNLTSFPLLDTSSGTNFQDAWAFNSLDSFPLIDTSSGTKFLATWRGNSSLRDFPANMFDNCLAINFVNAFSITNLTQSSIDGILVSIESNGTSNGTFDQSGGSAPSATGQAAIDAMRSRGWTITVTGGY